MKHQLMMKIFVYLFVFKLALGSQEALTDDEIISDLYEDVVTDLKPNSHLEAHVFNWADMIENYIKNLAQEGIRKDLTQELFDKATYTFNHKNGTDAVQKLSNRLTDYFRQRKEAASKIAMEATKAYDAHLKAKKFTDSLNNLPRHVYQDSTNPDQLPNRTQSSYFKQEICESKSTVTIAEEVPRSDNLTIMSVNWTYALEKVMLENHINTKKENLRWQYFGTKTGVLRLFPGREWSSNFIGFYEDYDPRTRPWYITATSEPKDVVIVMDCSASMEGAKFGIAKAVANTIIRTLTKRDYLNVVCARESAWDDVGKWHYYKPEVLSCQENRLVPATSVFRKDLMNKINDLKPGGTTELKNGFVKAFSLLQKSRPRTACQSIIIFVTDGKDTDGDQVRCGPGYYTRSGYVPGPVCKYNWTAEWNTVKELNGKMNTHARIFSYLTMENDSYTEKFPGKLACDSRGSFTKLHNGQNLISSLVDYFEYLAKSSPNLKNGLWTAPYLDNNGLGVMVTHAVPAFSVEDKSLIGVAGVDVTLEELEMIIMRYLWGSVTAFLIDKEGRTIFHPLLQQRDNLLDDPVFIKINNLEQDQQGKPEKFTLVAEEMMNSKSGSLRIEQGRRGMPKGDFRAGIRYDYMPLEYYYAPIKDSDYSVAFVLSDTDKVYRGLEEPEDWNKDDQSYYNLLIEYNSTDVRRNYSDLFEKLQVKFNEPKYPRLRVSYNYSSIFFAPQCYCDPNEYTFDDNLAQKTLNAHLYMNKLESGANDNGCEAGGIYEKGTRAHVLVTYPIEEYWRNRDPELVKHVMWTYVGMRSGVFRTYPGHRSVRNYDPTKRLWYRRTMTSPNRISISTPYMDSAGSGKIITFSQAVYEGMVSKNQTECSNITVTDGMKLPGGCICKQDDECMSGSCYVSAADNENSLRCATERIEAITSLDHGYDTFHDKVFDLTKAELPDGENRGCEEEYLCSTLHSKQKPKHPDAQRLCKTKCYLFDYRANIIVSSNFRNLTALNEVKYKGVSLGGIEGEIMLELIYRHNFFKRDESIDFQGSCSFTKSVARVTLKGIPVTPEEEDMKSKTRAQIQKFKNSYGCIQDVVSFVGSDVKLGNSRMIVGQISGPCVSGIYYLTSLKSTNLFLLVIENWRKQIDEANTSFDNFNCRITQKVVASGAHRIINGTCAHNETAIKTLKDQGKCSNLTDVTLRCTYNAGRYSYRFEFVIILIELLVLLNFY